MVSNFKAPDTSIESRKSTGQLGFGQTSNIQIFEGGNFMERPWRNDTFQLRATTLPWTGRVFGQKRMTLSDFQRIRVVEVHAEYDSTGTAADVHLQTHFHQTNPNISLA